MLLLDVEALVCCRKGWGPKIAVALTLLLLYVFAYKSISIQAVLSSYDHTETRIKRFGKSQAGIIKVFLSMSHSGKWKTESKRRNVFIKLCSTTVFYQIGTCSQLEA